MSFWTLHNLTQLKPVSFMAPLYETNEVEHIGLMGFKSFESLEGTSYTNILAKPR